MCIFHKWNKWKKYEEYYSWTPGILAPKSIKGKIYKGVEVRQKRECAKCGKIQDILIRD
jgi:hypothetical protein